MFVALHTRDPPRGIGATTLNIGNQSLAELTNQRVSILTRGDPMLLLTRGYLPVIAAAFKRRGRLG